MTNDIPVSTIGEQGLINAPFSIDNTLVDDTVILVNDPVALSGGQIVNPSETIKSKINPDNLNSNIRIYH